MFNLIPNFMIHGIVVIGVFGIIGSIVLSILPLIPIHFRLAIMIVSITMLSFGLFIEGQLSNELKWAMRVSDAEKVHLALQLQSETETRHLSESLAETEQELLEEKLNVKTEIVRVKEIINKECHVNPAAIDIHNAAIASQKGNPSFKKIK